MIQPRDGNEVAYVHNLAAFLIRARDQVSGGDKSGSVQFTDAFRSLKAWGDNRYRQDNSGLVEWAEMLAQEEPRNERLVAFMAGQDTRMKAAAPEPEKKDAPKPEPAPEPEKPKDPPPVPTTLANVVQRPSDKKSDKPALPESRPAPVAPALSNKPSPVLAGNASDREREAQRRKRKVAPKKETP